MEANSKVAEHTVWHWITNLLFSLYVPDFLFPAAAVFKHGMSGRIFGPGGLKINPAIDQTLHWRHKDYHIWETFRLSSTEHGQSPCNTPPPAPPPELWPFFDCSFMSPGVLSIFPHGRKSYTSRVNQIPPGFNWMSNWISRTLFCIYMKVFTFNFTETKAKLGRLRWHHVAI